MDQLTQMTLEDILAELVIWWENRRIPDQMDNLGFEISQTILSSFFKVTEFQQIITHESCFKNFADIIAKYHKTKQLQLTDLLEAEEDKQDFLLKWISNYSFELKSDLDANGRLLANKRAKIQFDQESEKLELFQASFQSQALSIIPKMIQEGLLKPQMKNDYDFNNEIGQLICTMLLDYVGQFEKLTEVDEMLTPYLSSLHYHAVDRYRSQMDKMLSNGFNPLQALGQIMTMNKGHGFPIQINSKSDFKKKVRDSFKGNVDDDVIEAVVNRCITPITNINLLKHNVIDMGNGQLVNLMHLISEDNFLLKGYFNILKYAPQKDNQEGDKNFEKSIQEDFIRAGFTNSHQGTIYGPHHPEKLPGDLDGDLDVVVTEGDHVLVLEVKRVDLRWDAQGIWNEKEKILWASLQLHKTQLAIQNKDEALMRILPEKPKTMISLIITPWFEYDHEFIGNFMKVSWFEIKYALEHMKGEWQNTPNKLQALIYLILEDQVWPHIRNGYEGYLRFMEEVQKENQCN